MRPELIALLMTAPPSVTPTQLSLDDAVAQALKTAPTVHRAEVSRDQAELTTLRANLDRFALRVDASVQELWTKSNIWGDGGSPEVTLGLSNLSARLEVPIFSGFRVESNVARAEHLEEASGHAVLAERRAVALAAARAYWSVRRVSLLADVTETAIRRLERAEAATKARVDAGLAPPLDANRALSRRRLQEAQLIDSRGQQRELESQLAILLGLDVPIALVEAPVLDKRVPIEDELLAEARARRPEVKEIDARLEAQHESIRFALSDYYPQLGVFGLFQLGNNPSLAGAGNRAVFASANPFGSFVGDLQLGVQLSLNIFDTMNTWTAVKRERIEAARLAQEKLRILRVVDTDVRTAHAKLVRLVGLIQKLDAAREIAQDNVQISETRYQDGDALVLDLLEAQLELFDVERQRTDALVEHMTARSEIDAAIGRSGAMPDPEGE